MTNKVHEVPYEPFDVPFVVVVGSEVQYIDYQPCKVIGPSALNTYLGTKFLCKLYYCAIRGWDVVIFDQVKEGPDHLKGFFRRENAVDYALYMQGYKSSPTS